MNTDYDESRDKEISIMKNEAGNDETEAAPGIAPKKRGGGNLDARAVPGDDPAEQEKADDEADSKSSS